MKRLALVAAAVALPASAIIFAAGNAVGARDQRLLAADDKNRTTLLARSCGKAGRLLLDPMRNEYVCAWTNPDGQMITAEIPQYPYLDQHLALR